MPTPLRVRNKAIRRVRVADLEDAPWNFRTHDDEQKVALGGAVGQIGWVGYPDVYETAEGRLRLCDGHLRKSWLIEHYGPDTEIEVNLTDFNDGDAKWATATKDTIAGLAGANEQALGELLAELETESEALQAMLEGLAEEHGLDVFEPAAEELQDPEPQVDRAAELQAEWQTATGQLWEVPGKAGVHRLLCGDSTKREDVERVMGGAKLAALVTDPPYGINAVKPGGVMRGGGMPTGSILKGTVGVDGVAPRGRYDVIANDDKPFDPAHLLDVAPVVLLFGGNHYADRLPRSSRWIVWDKKSEAASGTFFSDAELIWTNLKGVRCTIYRHTWSGMIRKGNRSIELPKRVHPTQKPVGLVVELIRDCVQVDGPIGDWYFGSGTTIVAAEQLGRVGYGIEISEAYTAVCLQRMKDLGLEPRLEE